MNLYLHDDQLRTLARHLARARRREIGGVLVGEHISHDVFRLVDLSFQHAAGTETCFVRRPEHHEQFFADFFKRTGYDFERYNYLGEWHSHPAFPATPSQTDLDQMQAIVEDESGTARFAVLVVTRLAARNELEISAMAFRPGCAPSAVALLRLSRPSKAETAIQQPWWRRILAPRRTDVRIRCIPSDDARARIGSPKPWRRC